MYSDVSRPYAVLRRSEATRKFQILDLYFNWGEDPPAWRVLTPECELTTEIRSARTQLYNQVLRETKNQSNHVGYFIDREDFHSSARNKLACLAPDCQGRCERGTPSLFYCLSCRNEAERTFWHLAEYAMPFLWHANQLLQLNYLSRRRPRA